MFSGGYSPALGFLHNGWNLAFVYDVADFYKISLMVPLAFQITAESELNVEKRARSASRILIHETKLLQQILPDIDHVLQTEDIHENMENEDDIVIQPWWVMEEFSMEEDNNGHHDSE